MNNQFTIQPFTLKDINFSLNVPAYQRPYCWGKEEIEKLLNDFKDNLREDIYYIGNVITIKNGDVFDLIDGQQRMTTLWILCLYLSQSNNTVIRFCKNHKKSRLNFAIREQTNAYLQDLLKESNKNNFWVIDDYLPIIDEQKKSNIDPCIFQNNNIAHAFNIIHHWCIENLHNNENEINALSQFIFEKVNFQFLTAPQNTDENKLFIQINTNGTQFQHADILKAELINAISDNDDKLKHAELWDKHVLKYYIKTYRQEVEYGDNQDIECTLFDLVDQANEEIYLNQDIKDEKLTDYRYEYIIDFNTLLIHCLFIYSKKYTIETPKSFNAEKLLDVFKEFRESINKYADHRNEKAINFLNLLKTSKEIIENQFLFKDKVENTFVFISEEHKSKKAEDENSIVVGDKDRLTLAQLQRMLYHSHDDKHYWMGIFLNEYIVNSEKVNINNLEKLENWISLNGRNFDGYLKYFNNRTKEEIIAENKIPIDTFLFGKISRYWFYKLEYILWKELKDVDKHIISRTSVEHVLTQKERGSYENHEINIDEFGNLVLLTVSENSGFSDYDLSEKHRYYTKWIKNPPYKMIDIYKRIEAGDLLNNQNPILLKSVLEEHKNEMINKIKSHYQLIKEQAI
ncbi:DUF262 domain-containing protein [Myroides odoratimimus]|uniref:DUF262 domain-containing protein n=1 Tax=Myroides odoratimimus TaxID=76832 RepID=UPI002578B559|nr:DUF262 domain-containing HNH endonuclease family protein [Myroides odoratimimus]MDM1679851.1 DUF262 domain-containing protein [Myroides odoratimimus]